MIYAAADTGTILVAACHQRAGSVRLGTGLCSTIIIVHIVLDDQGAGAVYVCFFNTGVVFTAAENGIIAVQLKFGVAVALDLDGCRAAVIPTGLRLNVHILQGHIGGVAVFGGNGDGVGSGLGLAGGLVFGG